MSTTSRWQWPRLISKVRKSCPCWPCAHQTLDIRSAPLGSVSVLFQQVAAHWSPILDTNPSSPNKVQSRVNWCIANGFLQQWLLNVLKELARHNERQCYETSRAMPLPRPYQPALHSSSAPRRMSLSECRVRHRRQTSWKRR